MAPSNLSQEQEEVLAKILSHRLTVVRAGPGSGKTRVFVEALKRSIDDWSKPRQGIAALSFTNVAHEVIAERLGGHPGTPHFVGTIDSFLLRFVVRPFGHLVGMSTGGAVLIPSPVDESLTFPQLKYAKDSEERVSLYRFTFKGGDEAMPMFSCRTTFGTNVDVVPEFCRYVHSMKKELWRSRGLVTHSDSQFLASVLLNSPYRDQIVRLISLRFPMILIDEFQDTGRFQGRAIIELLRSEQVSGAVVGDPDQAIYQFGGANREVFTDVERLSGAVVASLTKSYRCTRSVASVVSKLSRTEKKVIPRDDAPAGETVLIVHDLANTSHAINAVLRACDDTGVFSKDARIGVLARRRTSIQDLTYGPAAKLACPWKSGTVNRLSGAMRFFLKGEPTSAARAVQHALADFLFGDESLSRVDLQETLESQGLTETDWRRAVSTILLESTRTIDGETWNAWVARMKAIVDEQATNVGWVRDGRVLGSTFKSRPDATKPCRSVDAGICSPTSLQVVPMTIHGAKGREFDGVIIVIPKPTEKKFPCPSIEWWSNDLTSEEREVAFVGCSRAKSTLVLAVHRTTYEGLCSRQKSFVDLFKVCDLGASDVSTKTRQARAPAVVPRRRRAKTTTKANPA